MIKPQLEDVEKIFTRVDFHFGVVKFLNGGSRPRIVDYHKEVEWEDVLLLAIADKLIPLVGRIIDAQQVASLCRMLKSPIQAWLNRISHQTDRIEDFAVDITENGKELVAMWTGGDGFYDLRNPGAPIKEITWMPEEAHLYNVSVLHLRMQKAVSKYLTDKNAPHAATAQVKQYQTALEQSGYLRNDLGDDPNRPVRDGGAKLEPRDDTSGATGRLPGKAAAD